VGLHLYNYVSEFFILNAKKDNYYCSYLMILKEIKNEVDYTLKCNLPLKIIIEPAKIFHSSLFYPLCWSFLSNRCILK